ncbi:c-type cytochrome [Singulisphaera acidiphila]|uniref:Cytochrome c1 n=1 Tax=Singulisphaera acidiphila (strain ATCC BAA-1392 / DSM 18658 / VKM B-2454 / MOB10) TaxID=886293 RepID=L0DNM8_SINAD|nr:c-type cytochrome [Singulisphaera acidiphila]AGA30448.1 cytochrome c1 [Singulisphaera acidiphila DSM 18658]
MSSICVRRCLLFGIVICISLGPTSRSPAANHQDEELDEAERPGLVASFSSASVPKTVVRQILFDLNAHWGSASPDARIPATEFVGRWEGLILIQSPGVHRFQARSDGEIDLKVAGRLVLKGNGETLKADSIDLPAGFSPISLEYRHRQGEAHVAIDWEGPGFGREPIPARLFYHDASKRLQPDRFEEGRRLADRIGCANCHQILDLPVHRNQGPPLADAGHAIDPAWLDAWLTNPDALRPGSRMPSFGHGFSKAETADIRAYLASLAPPSFSVTPEARMALNVAAPARGRLLFRSIGCLGCHTKGSPPAHEPAAPDLSDLPRKRSVEWLTAFLGPAKANKTAVKHRHELRLTVDEAAHLAAYLGTSDQAPPPRPLLDGDGDPARGLRLVESARCVACHALPGLKPAPADIKLTAGSPPDAGCLAVEPSGPLVPHFSLTEEQRQALREFVAGLPSTPAPTSRQTLADDSLRRLNCFGCHARDGRGGEELGGRIATLLAEDPELGGLKGTLTPPNLTAVGDKLRHAYLGTSVRSTAPTARPWLSVRMPTFAFEPGEADAIVAFLQVHDRMQSEPDPPNKVARLDARATEAATQLIGQRGFGCISCHVLSGRIPPGGEPETLGPDLTLAHRRMADRYFHRWIANPQRIIAGTPMPQFAKPIESIPGTLDDQLNQIWRLLASGSLADVASAGAREVLKHEGDRALVVRDMVLLPEAPQTKYIPRALAIGLKNDHSLLFDADRLTWLSWWRGGFLSRTKSGRLWEWHPEGESIWVAPNRQPPIVFVGPDRLTVFPTEVRERFGSFQELSFEAAAVSLAYTLHGPKDTDVVVQERIEPMIGGWERQVTVTGVPEGYTPALFEHPPNGKLSWAVGKARASLQSPDGRVESAPNVAGDPNARWFMMKPSDQGQFTKRIRLTVEP